MTGKSEGGAAFQRAPPPACRLPGVRESTPQFFFPWLRHSQRATGLGSSGFDPQETRPRFLVRRHERCEFGRVTPTRRTARRSAVPTRMRSHDRPHQFRIRGAPSGSPTVRTELAWLVSPARSGTWQQFSTAALKGSGRWCETRYIDQNPVPNPAKGTLHQDFTGPSPARSESGSDGTAICTSEPKAGHRQQGRGFETASECARPGGLSARILLGTGEARIVGLAPWSGSQHRPTRPLTGTPRARCGAMTRFGGSAKTAPAWCTGARRTSRPGREIGGGFAWSCRNAPRVDPRIRTAINATSALPTYYT